MNKSIGDNYKYNIFEMEGKMILRFYNMAIDFNIYPNLIDSPKE